MKTKEQIKQSIMSTMKYKLNTKRKAWIQALEWVLNDGKD